MTTLAPEFSGAEFAAMEFAFGGKLYADIIGASTLAFTGEASFGMAVTINAVATFGVSPDSDHTAVASTKGEDTLVFDPAAHAYFAAYTQANAAWNHVADGRTAYTQDFSAAALWSFDGLGVITDETTADAILRFDTTAPTSAIARTEGAITLGFAGAASGQTLAHTSVEGQWRFTGAAHAVAMASTTGYTTMRFTGQGHARWFAAAQALGQVTFAAMARAQAAAAGRGETSLTFNAAAPTQYRQYIAFQAAALQHFATAAYTQTMVGARATAPLTFAGTARVGVVLETAGHATLSVTGGAYPGRSVWRFLPLAYDSVVRPDEPRGIIRPAEDRDEDWR